MPYTSTVTSANTEIILSEPTPDDGMDVFELVANCSPLDTNSSYCNLLQCTHFSDTSITAKKNEKLVGFISGYVLPKKPSHLFIWQVAVDKSARGLGLAKQMLKGIIKRPKNNQIEYINTTITHDNQASWALFESLAKSLNAKLIRSTLFEKETHFKGQHETEFLLTIGPI